MGHDSDIHDDDLRKETYTFLQSNEKSLLSKPSPEKPRELAIISEEKSGIETPINLFETNNNKNDEDEQYYKALKSLQFIMLFLTMSFSISSCFIFQMNIKNFGLNYFSDEILTKTSIVGSISFFIMRFTIGAIIDKFGMKNVYRTIIILVVINFLMFYSFMDNIFMFYICIFIFYGLHASLSTSITISTSFIYGHNVGKRLQAWMHGAFSGGGILAT